MLRISLNNVLTCFRANRNRDTATRAEEYTETRVLFVTHRVPYKGKYSIAEMIEAETALKSQ